MLVGICLITAACTTDADPDGDEAEADGAEAAADTIDSAQGASDRSETDESAEPEPEVPTLDGSAASAEPATDVWTTAIDGKFIPDADSSAFGDVAAGPDGRLVIGGHLVDYRDRLTRATIWQSIADPAADLTRMELPTLADGVDSSVATLTIPGPDSGLARADISALAAGTVGSGGSQRAAVWVERDGRWEQVKADAFASLDREWVVALVAGDGQLLLLGGTADADGASKPAAWSSTNGLTWTRLADRFDQRPDARFVGGASTAVGTVLLGRDPAVDFARSQLWFSPDGQTWEHVEPPSFAGDGAVFVNSVVADPAGGFLAVGSVGTTTDVFQPASWTSADGRTWSEPSTAFQVNDLNRTISRGFGAGEVVVDEAGVGGTEFVASGTNGFVQHVWRSADGVTWTPEGNVLDADDDGVAVSGIAVGNDAITIVGDGDVIRHAGAGWDKVFLASDVVPQPVELPWINDLAATGSGFLAVGGVENRSGLTINQAWVSADLQTWDEVGTSLLSLAQVQSGPYGQAIATTDGYLAVAAETTALEGRRNRPGVTHLHAIADGVMRRPTTTEPGEARHALSSVAVIDDRVAMAGLRFDGETIEPVLVEGTLVSDTFERLTARTDLTDRTVFEPATIEVPGQADREAWSELCASADTMVAVLLEDYSSASSVAFYHRPVDAEWTRSTGGPELDPDGGSTWVNSCANGPAGFLAAGVIENGSDGDDDGALWLSADGQDWAEIEAPASVVDGTADASIDDIAVFDDHYLLVGDVDAGGAGIGTLWIGGPGTGWTEIPAANEPIGFNVSAVAVDGAGTVVISGWQDGRALMVSAPIDAILASS